MRIIAGSARSLPLKTLPGKDTRPTTDRIKETLFNMIQNEVPGSVFLDLFSGSGGIALEAVSRGAEQAVLVENNRKAAAVIQENINFTKFNEQCRLMITDAMTALRRLEHQYEFDIVFMDPPYGMGLEQEALEYLAGSSLIRNDSLILVECRKEADPESYRMDGRYDLSRVKEYKTNRHLFLHRTE